jgi:hypothetical protein
MAAMIKVQTLLAAASLRMRTHMACLRWQRKQRMRGRAVNKCVFTRSKAVKIHVGHLLLLLLRLLLLLLLLLLLQRKSQCKRPDTYTHI